MTAQFDAFRSLIGLLLLSAASVLVSDSSVAAAPSLARCEMVDGRGECSLHKVSMIQLIANPEAFHGKRVRVIGYLILEFEGNALYLHAEDSQHGLTDNGIWVDAPRAGLGAECKSNAYALLEGRFNAEHNGHMGLWSGALEEVTRCTAWN